MSSLPAITGPQLIKLLAKDGWIKQRYATHGMWMKKVFPDRTRVTVIPTAKESLPKGTLNKILGPQQTNLGRQGLEDLIKKY